MSTKPAAYDTADSPSIEDLENWMVDGGCETPDGCWVEPDGHCPHGQSSRVVVLGPI
jgi:hypothetical protein